MFKIHVYIGLLIDDFTHIGSERLLKCYTFFSEWPTVSALLYFKFSVTAQQIHTTQNQCWFNADPTLNQHLFNVLCLLGKRYTHFTLQWKILSALEH